jgi:hypothetical protein
MGVALVNAPLGADIKMVVEDAKKAAKLVKIIS